MYFQETDLPGVFVVEIEPRKDERGFFARTFCQEEFRSHGLNPDMTQCSISWNKFNLTLRGLHWQAAPYEEAKLVRCLRGEIFDVAVDIRPRSETFGQWTGAFLDEESRQALYIPEGFAHGFLTLADETEVLYTMSAPYAAEAARGMYWDDPDIAVAWPTRPRMISEKDQSLPSFARLFRQPPRARRAPSAPENQQSD